MFILISMLVAVGLAVGGCHAGGGGPRIDLDLRVLDCVPVVPIQTPTGFGTGLLLPDGRAITCSHIFPRGQSDPEARIAGRQVRCSILQSGDGLKHEWRWWSLEDPPCVAGDWVTLTSEPPIHAAEIFGSPLNPAPSPDPPRVGETVYIVGYSVDERQFTRYWVPAVIVDTPKAEYGAFGDSVIWLRSARLDPGAAQHPGAARGAGRPGTIRRGLSGAPVLRHRGNGSLELCGLLVGVEAEPGSVPTGIGAAIPLPAIDAEASPPLPDGD